MSYILDALKKSERERQRGKIPTINSIHDPSPVSPANHFSNQRTKYSAISVLFLVVAAAAIIWYWLKYLPTTDTPVVMEQASTMTEAEKGNLSIHSPDSSAAESPAPATLAPVENNIAILPPPPTITTHSKKIKLLPDQAIQPEVKEKAARPPSREPPVIPNIRDLPTSIQTTIPELNLAGHTYSDTPEKRMIIINGDILREGDRVSDMVKLIEITWTGVILDHNGEQFTVDIE